MKRCVLVFVVVVMTGLLCIQKPCLAKGNGLQERAVRLNLTNNMIWQYWHTEPVASSWIDSQHVIYAVEPALWVKVYLPEATTDMLFPPQFRHLRNTEEGIIQYFEDLAWHYNGATLQIRVAEEEIPGRLYELLEQTPGITITGKRKTGDFSYFIEAKCE